MNTEEIISNYKLIFPDDHIKYITNKKNLLSKWHKNENISVLKNIIEVVNNKIIIPRKYDIVYSLEIKADQIDKANLLIGGIIINIFNHLEKNENGFWEINFGDVFLEIKGIMMFLIYAHQVELKLEGQNIEKAYMKGGYLTKETKTKIFEYGNGARDNLISQENYYDNLEIDGDTINILGNWVDITYKNIISELIFDFEEEIDFDKISIYDARLFTDERGLITIFNKNDIKFISKKKFIIKDFNYKIFIFEKIKIQFDKHIKSKFKLTTKNYNILRCIKGIAGIKFDNTVLRRNIITALIFSNGFVDIPEQLYLEKVVPKKDNICSISQEEFEENEKRTICGVCFTSYKEDNLIMWFQTSKKRECPYGRCNGVWYQLIKN